MLLVRELEKRSLITRSLLWEEYFFNARLKFEDFSYGHPTDPRNPSCPNPGYVLDLEFHKQPTRQVKISRQTSPRADLSHVVF
jgi:hypothetical protein